MGTTGGGLWKTSDAGQRWNNISDGFFEMGSVGAISVSESNPNILYCGMGEHAPRGVMTSYGDGVYKSTDAGKTWKHMGLKATQHISRIKIHPTNPDIVYVAAQGALYGPTAERGIYKSIDGGLTWKNVLFVNNLTGCAELSMDANYPEIMYAAMWEHQRKPNIVISGGEGSGLYKSIDSGETWSKIHKGLPEEKGKMAIAVSPANSNKVYALIESDSDADKGGLFVSSNAGESWSMVSGDNRLVQRAWYYIEVFADPNDEDTVYVLSAPALRSTDGGQNWETLSGPHGDYHDLWINPKNSNNMVIADDGGAGISFNFAKSWSTQANMPTAQFYRISTDNLFPYNIYGGQQDNSAVKIASLSTGSSGISERDWSNSAGGESAFLAFDPDNPRYVMGGQYLGTVEVLDTESKASTQVMAAPIQYLGREARNMKYLYNWNTPIIRSNHEPGTFYKCAQLVLRTKDMGQTWEEISGDLTRDNDATQDLKVHKGNLIVATSGRSFWILDDLSALTNYDSSKKGLNILKPGTTYNGSWRSQLSGSSDKFDGTNPFNGVNPANGMVIYYQLPNIDDEEKISLDILDANGKLVRIQGDKTVETTSEITAVPTYENSSASYKEHDVFMSEMEQKLTDMHNKLETLYCPEMDAWDKDMIQRKSQAYDDVENFVNKFSAEYLFLLNQTGGSDIPKVNKGSKNRRAELDPQWEVLKARATQLIENSIPNFNKKLWEAGIGAVRM
ncbi:hypothetical protein GQR58_026417 [Nymphon striatum]|nr:hypothetical protein GQR58_026417 [Nymphon striatum]